MEASGMRELLQGYLNELDWSGEVTKDNIMEHLAGRDDALRTMVNEYVTEGSYQSVEHVMNLIPAQAWQDAQGDEWRGAESQYVEDTDSNFQNGPVGQDQSDVGRPGGSDPSTPGFGQSAGASGDDTDNSTGTANIGEAGSNAGEVDLGVGGDAETAGESS